MKNRNEEQEEVINKFNKEKEHKTFSKNQRNQVKIIDKNNSDFYKKIKEHNINLRHQTQAEQNTRSREYCSGCDLYVCKLHLCSAIGAWINIDTHHLHIIVGKEEEDVRRTRELEDDEYSVYYFNNKQDLQNK